jgi:signal transduction histidine kinase
MNVPPSTGDFAALEASYNSLKEQFTELQKQYQDMMLRKQETDLKSRRAEYLYNQLSKEKEELIIEKIDIRTAMEEFKAAQEEVILKNEALEKAYKEIDDNRKLQERSAQQLNQKNEELILRGIELRTALEELRATQEELLVSQKMSALGHVIANIAHEINTPIGALYAASQNVTNSLPKLLESFPTLFKEMPMELKPLFFQLVELAKAGVAQNESTRDERTQRREVMEKLEAMGAHNAENLARSLVKIGQLDNLEEYKPLFLDEYGERLVDSCLAIGRLRANIETISMAVGKTQKTILSLKSYTDDELTPQKVGVVDLVSNVDEIVSHYRALRRNGLEIFTHYEEGLPPITCHPDQLSQVWNHLFLNAAQAMPRGGTLSVRVQRDATQPPDGKPHLQVTVSDTGTGIPPIILPKIFDAFFTTRPEGEGSGLGLFVAKKIVSRHHGTITVTSEPGNTTFTVTLPVKAVTG